MEIVVKHYVMRDGEIVVHENEACLYCKHLKEVGESEGEE